MNSPPVKIAINAAELTVDQRRRRMHRVGHPVANKVHEIFRPLERVIAWSTALQAGKKMVMLPHHPAHTRRSARVRMHRSLPERSISALRSPRRAPTQGGRAGRYR